MRAEDAARPLGAAAGRLEGRVAEPQPDAPGRSVEDHRLGVRRVAAQGMDVAAHGETGSIVPGVVLETLGDVFQEGRMRRLARAHPAGILALGRPRRKSRLRRNQKGCCGSAAFEIALGAISKTPALRAGRQRLWL